MHLQNKIRALTLAFAAFWMPLAWGDDVEAPTPAQAIAACQAANDTPWEDGSQIFTAGIHGNAKRRGVGWALTYDETNTQIMLTLLTFDGDGRPSWLATRFATPSGQTFTAPLYRYSLSGTSTVTATRTQEGSVGIYFMPDDPTQMAVRWYWDDLPSSVGTQLECLKDFNRGSPADTPRSAELPSAAETPGVRVAGVNSLFSGYWNKGVSTNPGGTISSVEAGAAPAIVTAVVQDTYITTRGRFTEANSILTYDASGKSMWLTVQMAQTSPFVAPPFTTKSGTLHYVLADKSMSGTTPNGYPQGFPINNCSYPAKECYLSQPVGTFERTYSEGAGNRTTTVAVSAGTPIAIANAPAVAQVAGGTYFFPATATLRRTAYNHGIALQDYTCTASSGASTCNLWVSWNADNSASARAWRKNLLTGAYTMMLGSNDGGVAKKNGFMVDAVPVNSRVQYELWTNDPNNPGSSPVFYGKTPEARAYATPVQQGDSSDGVAESPIAPVPPSQMNPPPSSPTLDASDAVGALAGEFKVDGNGNTNMSFPIAAPPGRGGLAPQLSLNYSSAGGDGYYGTGFSLSGVSAITACRKAKEFGDGDAATANADQFCLDGQRLILVGGTHRATNAEYRTEIDNQVRVRISVVGTGNIKGSATPLLTFKVQAKDGSTRIFGGLNGTVHTLKDSTVNAIAWMQTSLSDVVQNSITYTYSAPSLSGERRLSQVSYNGGTTVVAISYAAGSPRNDIAYSKLGASRRTGLVDGLRITEGGVPLRYYALSYSNQWGAGTRPRLSSISECDRGPLDVGSPTCYPATTLQWGDDSLAPNGDVVKTTQADSSNSGLSNVHGFKFGDFNGDGRTDLFWTQLSGPGTGSTNSLNVSMSAGASANVLLGPKILPQGLGGDSNRALASRDDMFHVFDFNGDGKDDVLYATMTPEGTSPVVETLSWKLAYSGLVGSFPVFTSDFSYGPGLPFGSFPYGTDSAASSVRGQSIFADFNADGQPDLLFRIPKSHDYYLVLLERNIDGDIFAASHGPVDFQDLGGTICDLRNAKITKGDLEHSSAVDQDGDGRTDLFFYVSEDANECGYTEGQPGDGEITPIEPGLGIVVPGIGPTPTVLENFKLISFKPIGFIGSSFKFQAQYPFEEGREIIVSAQSADRVSNHLRLVDVNADGLVDVVSQSAPEEPWRYVLGGSPASVAPRCITPSCNLTQGIEDSSANKVQLLDLDGDGKLDFWYPTYLGLDKDGNPIVKYYVYLWKGSIDQSSVAEADFSSSPVTTKLGAEEKDGWQRATADFNGDGVPDRLVVKATTNASGDWTAERFTTSYSARGMLRSITNGLGAKTEIEYAPLTFSSVYRRDYDAPTFSDWGQGSPIFDIGGPNYVVRRVSSSAPTITSPSAMTTVEYSYAGLKVQSGGRGSLGFRRVSTLDREKGIQVDTWYEQKFPLTGTAKRTLTRKLSSLPADSACNYAAGGSGCLVYVPPCSTSNIGLLCDPTPAGAQTLKDSIDQWDFRIGFGGSAGAPPLNPGVAPLSGGGPVVNPPVATPGPYFVARVFSMTESFDPLVSTTVPLTRESVDTPLFDPDGLSNPPSSYDSYGNLLKSTSLKCAGSSGVGCGTGASLSVTSRFTYESPVTSGESWRLGRLSQSDVVTVRSPVAANSLPTAMRRSLFTYEPTTGLLSSESVRGMIPGTARTPDSEDPLTPATTTHYTYDTAGNKNGTFTCSASIAASTCKAMRANGAGGYQFHPATAAQVMRYSRTEYDVNQRYPIATFEAMSMGGSIAGEVMTSYVDGYSIGGDPLLVTDANGVSQKMAYGKLGRKYFGYSSTGVAVTETYATCATGNCPTGMGLAFVVTVTQPGAPTKKAFHDILGRPVLSLAQGFAANHWIATRTGYDVRGNAKYQSDPYFALNATSGANTVAAGSTRVESETAFDHLNRPLSVTKPGHGTTTTSYLGLTTTVTMPANKNGAIQQVAKTLNAIGDVEYTTDGDGGTVTYEYDAIGNAVKVSQTGSTITTTYDRLGRKTGMNDPDMGRWTYTVNDAGELIRQVSARGTCTVNRYDGRGRVWERNDYTDASCTTLETKSEWGYDTVSYGFGGLGWEQTTVGGTQKVRRDFQYDQQARLARVDTLLDGHTYVNRSTFDQHGRPFQSFFQAQGMPETGEMATYNEQGYSKGSQSAFGGSNGLEYWRIIAVNARGQVTEERRVAGAVVTTTRTFDPNTGRITNINTGNGYLQNLAYAYDTVGNLWYRDDLTNGANKREDFSYDKLQRVTGSALFRAGNYSTPVGSSSWNFAEASDGNFESVSGNTYGYGDLDPACSQVAGSVAAGPHAVTTARGQTLCYNANGSVIGTLGAHSRLITYSAYELPTQLTSLTHNAKVGFEYGPNRERLRRLDYASGGHVSAQTVTHYVGNAEVRWTVDPNNSANAIEEVRRYLGGMLVVQRRTALWPNYSIHREYFLTDAQGSTYAVLDDLGAVINASSNQSFDAFGARRDVTNWEGALAWTAAFEGQLKDTTRRGYTGHEQVDSIGLIHMNGRIYDPQLARFMQADPFIQDPSSTQSYNRYSYVMNNPLVATDPTGYWGARQQGYLRTAAAIVITVYTGGLAGGAWGSITVGSGQAFAVAVAGGFAAGAVQTGTLKGAATGAVSAAAFYGVGELFSTRGAWHEAGQGASGHALRALSHGAVGGVMSELQGGRFGHGFISAGVSSYLTPELKSNTSAVEDVLIAAVIGGTASVAAGGKFQNGAITAAFAKSFNRLAHWSTGKQGVYHKYGGEGEGDWAVCSTSQAWCTPERGYQTLPKYVYPGQDPSNPVKDGAINMIYWPSGEEVGHIQTFLEPHTYSIYNYTLPDHDFYSGYVRRQMIVRDGTLYLRTSGEGTNINAYRWLQNMAVWRPGFYQNNENFRQTMIQDWLKGQK